MSRKCELTGIKAQFGNNVSHSQRKTKRRFNPNIRVVRYKSEATGQEYKLKVVAKCIRAVEKAGGFDSFMLTRKSDKMSDKAKTIQKTITKKHKPA